MMSIDDYRKREQECLEKARDAIRPEETIKWIELADAWLKLGNGEHLIMPPDHPVPPAACPRH